MKFTIDEVYAIMQEYEKQIVDEAREVHKFNKNLFKDVCMEAAGASKAYAFLIDRMKSLSLTDTTQCSATTPTE